MQLHPRHGKNAWPSLRHLDDTLSAWGATCPAGELWITGRTRLLPGEALRQLADLPEGAPVLIRVWGDALWNMAEWLTWEAHLRLHPVVFVAACQAQARLLRLLVDAPVVVVPYPLPQASGPGADRAVWLTQHGIAADARIVLYGGRKNISKGLPSAWSAWQTIHAEDPRAVFVQVGRWEDDFPQAVYAQQSADIQSQASRLARYFSDRWYDFPECGSAEITRWLDAADLVVCPSVFPEEDGAIFAREACARGRRVLATAWGAHADLAGPRLVPVHPTLTFSRPDPAAWSMAALAAWRDPTSTPWEAVIPSARETAAQAGLFHGFTPWLRELAECQRVRGTQWLMRDGAWDSELWGPWQRAYGTDR